MGDFEADFNVNQLSDLGVPSWDRLFCQLTHKNIEKECCRKWFELLERARPVI